MLSADGERLRFAVPLLVLLQQLNAVVAIEFDGTPVTLVADQQGALLQAALTVSLGWNTQLGDVLSQVFLNCCTLCLRPGTLQNTSLSYNMVKEY